MGVWKRLTGHFDLMRQMFNVTGAMGNPATADAIEINLKGAMMRCASCSETQACREWLGDAQQGDAPPAFCRNSGFIRQVQSQTRH